MSGDTPPIGNRRVRRIYREGMYDDSPPDYPTSYTDLREAAWEMEIEGATQRGGADEKAPPSTRNTAGRNKE